MSTIRRNNIRDVSPLLPFSRGRRRLIRLFNHESPIRGEPFVTRKTTRGLARRDALVAREGFKIFQYRE
jgi:hypothetical protein